MGKPDDAEEVAKDAYHIYRSMKETEPRDPLWEELSRSDKARFEWMIRYDRMRPK